MSAYRKNAKPNLEKLEVRDVPANLGWTGAVNGNWNTAGNWQDRATMMVAAAPPGMGDVAILDGVGGGLANRDCTVNVNVSVAELRALAGYTGTVYANNNVTSGTVITDSSRISIANLKHLDASHYSATNSNVSGLGALRVLPGAVPFGTFAAHGSQFDVLTLELGAGVNGTLNGLNTFNSMAVSNAGTLAWQSGDLALGVGTVFTNSGGLDVSCNNKVTGAVNARFVNTGEMEKDVVFGVTTFETRFENVGLAASVRMKKGTLALVRESLSAAAYHVEGGAYVAFAGAFASATLDGGTRFDGAGGVTITDGAQAVVGAGATVRVYCYLNVDGANTLLDAEPGKVESWGTFEWSGGKTRGDVDLRGATTLTNNANGKTYAPGTMKNYGVFTIEGTGQFYLNLSTFENYGTVNLASTAGIQEDPLGFPGGEFKNMGLEDGLGLVRKTGGEMSAISVQFDNKGVLDLNGYTIEFQTYDVTQSDDDASTTLGGGTLKVAPTKAFKLNAGTFNGDSGFVTGHFSGNLVNSGGTVIVGADPDRLAFKVVGDYTQGANGKLVIVANGHGAFGKLRVTGDASLEGSIEVVLAGGFNPPAGTVDEEIVAVDGVFYEDLSVTLPPAWALDVDDYTIEVQN